MSGRRHRERGNSIVLAVVVLAGLALIGMHTVFSVRAGVATNADDRFHELATYAAESGAAMAIEHLRGQLDAVHGWSALVSPRNATIQHPAFAGNGALPGAPANPFSADQAAWFDVAVLNNRDDPGFATGRDDDAQVIVRVTGHASGSVAVIEWTIHGEVGKPMTFVGWHQVL